MYEQYDILIMFPFVWEFRLIQCSMCHIVCGVFDNLFPLSFSLWASLGRHKVTQTENSLSLSLPNSFCLKHSFLRRLMIVAAFAGRSKSLNSSKNCLSRIGTTSRCEGEKTHFHWKKKILSLEMTGRMMPFSGTRSVEPVDFHWESV